MPKADRNDERIAELIAGYGREGVCFILSTAAEAIERHGIDPETVTRALLNVTMLRLESAVGWSGAASVFAEMAAMIEDANEDGVGGPIPADASPLPN